MKYPHLTRILSAEFPKLKLDRKYSPEYEQALRVLQTLSDAELDQKDLAVQTLKQAGLNDMANKILSLTDVQCEEFVMNNLDWDEDPFESNN